MILSLSAIGQQGQLREFSCQFEEIETGFDLLNSIVAQGDKLVSARLKDDQFNMSLSIEAFDGESFLLAIQQLKVEWESILTDPPMLTTSSSLLNERIKFNNQQLAYWEGKITNLTGMVSWTISLLERAAQMKETYTKISFIEHHYQSLFQLYQGQLIKAYLIQDQLLRRLNGLSYQLSRL